MKLRIALTAAADAQIAISKLPVKTFAGDQPATARISSVQNATRPDRRKIIVTVSMIIVPSIMTLLVIIVIL